MPDTHKICAGCRRINLSLPDSCEDSDNGYTLAQMGRALKVDLRTSTELDLEKIMGAADQRQSAAVSTG